MCREEPEFAFAFAEFATHASNVQHMLERSAAKVHRNAQFFFSIDPAAAGSIKLRGSHREVCVMLTLHRFFDDSEYSASDMSSWCRTGVG